MKVTASHHNQRHHVREQCADIAWLKHSQLAPLHFLSLVTSTYHTAGKILIGKV